MVIKLKHSRASSILLKNRKTLFIEFIIFEHTEKSLLLMYGVIKNENYENIILTFILMNQFFLSS